MSRRPFGVQILLTVGVVGLFLFGLYQYNDVQTRLKRSADKNEKLTQDQESMSAQLQVLYDDNAKLKKALKHEEEQHSKTKTELQDEKKELETKLTREKLTVQERLNALTSENQRLQGLHDDLQTEVSKLKEKLSQSEDDKVKAQEQHQQEYMQLKQERENDVAQLKDQVADLDRRNKQFVNKKNDNQGENAGENHAEDSVQGRHAGARRKPRRNQHDTGNNEDNENDNDLAWQIKKPGDEKPKGYFDLKTAKHDNVDDPAAAPDNNENDAEADGDTADDHNKDKEGEQQQQQHMQVAPPKVIDKDSKPEAAGTGGAASNVVGPPAGLAGSLRAHQGGILVQDTGYRGQRGQHDPAIPQGIPGDHINREIPPNKGIPGGLGLPHNNGIPGDNGIPGGHNAGVGGQGDGLDSRRVLGGRLGNNGLNMNQIGGENAGRVHEDSVRGGEGGGGLEARPPAQIAQPHVQERPPAVGGLDAHNDNALEDGIKNDAAGDDANNNDDGDVEGDRGEGVGRGGRVDKEEYEYEKEAMKKERNQDRRGPNVGPVDDSQL